MKENIEEAIKKLETISKIKKENEEIIDCATGCGIELILDYERLQKENLRLRYQDIPYLEGEIKGYKTRIEELKKEKEELKEQNKYEWIRQHCLPQDLINKWYIPKQKIKDKIEEYREQRAELTNGNFWKYERNIYDDTSLFVGIEVLIELLEEE